ncbi:MDR/zinc-dependent alcohol dehydrogenase-like family protein [Saccharothrix variisporea]|nr:hypothetical protein [Saccharothrix variisporea]
MRTTSTAAVLTGVGAAAAAVVGRLVVARRKADSRDEHWLAVTVHCSPDRLHDLPEPLAELRQDVELRIRPATGDKGTELPVVIDRLDYRLEQAERVYGVETLNYARTDIGAALREMTGGRGPDVCIEAVGCEAHSFGPQHVYDQVKSKLKLETDRPIAVRDAIHACRKGGTVFVLGVFSGLVDKFPLGAVMNKGLTLRAAQQHGQR